MSSTYTTIQGDTWDGIAYKLYGDEKYMKNLIEANWLYTDVLVFSAGVELTVPEITEEEKDDDNLPIWRQFSSDSDDDDEESTDE
jgi:phage tail protein X